MTPVIVLRCPQGLKPDLCSSVMSELKLRPPKNRGERELSSNQDGTKRFERMSCWT
jgi:hypothetical protein